MCMHGVKPIRDSLDQVDGQGVATAWAQPRAISQEQIAELPQRLTV